MDLVGGIPVIPRAGPVCDHVVVSGTIWSGQWWYEQGGRTTGPVAAEEIRALIDRGTLTSYSRVIPDGSQTWATVAQYGPALGLPPGPPVAPPRPPAPPAPPSAWASMPPPAGAPPVAPTPTDRSPTSDRDYLSALLLSIFLGWLGIDRFYLGWMGLGVLKLLTFGGFGIWWLIDVILIATRSLGDASRLPLARH